MYNYKYDDHLKAVEGGLCELVSGSEFIKVLRLIREYEDRIDKVSNQLDVCQERMAVEANLEEILEVLSGLIDPTEEDLKELEDTEDMLAAYQDRCYERIYSGLMQKLYELEDKLTPLYARIGM
jgi:predicted nuclease with TOPRIM domain